MNAPYANFLLPAAAPALPGTWKLAKGRALTLQPRTNGILRIAHGRVWATVDGPHGVTPTDSGDHILELGRSMWVRPGQRVVIEAWNATGPSYFSWDPVFEPIKVKAPRRRVDFAAALLPLADLRTALVLAGDALRRLVMVLARQALPATHNGRHGQACPAR
ncbi:DUF2917 domain-containing protein [Ramlibacter sp. XY19]|uniref:DUF2917 domain-containing protein n=1 Tax=Ramlibacter paludis TaxID=2908000 RepID=UPI0023DBAB78|nr:DUF2917 domain-containing protein [Ramlibacter paludis]MCG2591359.1 DUF2917 domain-containing protein [Ramlibacter paludis]